MNVVKISIDPDKLSDGDAFAERDYSAWKREKIENGLAQAKDRNVMIPADRLLRGYGDLDATDA